MFILQPMCTIHYTCINNVIDLWSCLEKMASECDNWKYMKWMKLWMIFFLCYSLWFYTNSCPCSVFFVICKHLLWKQMSYICPKKGLDPCLKRAFYCDTLLSSARIVQSSWTFWWMITTQWDLSVLIYEVCMIVNAWRRYTWRVSRSICV